MSQAQRMMAVLNELEDHNRQRTLLELLQLFRTEDLQTVVVEAIWQMPKKELVQALFGPDNSVDTIQQMLDCGFGDDVREILEDAGWFVIQDVERLSSDEVTDWLRDLATIRRRVRQKEQDAA